MFVREDMGEIAVLRMAHGKVSALDTEFCDAIRHELEQLRDGAPRAVVLTGSGTTFSAGVNLYKVLDGGVQYGRVFLPSMEGFLRALLVFPRPLVAAVNGHAIAGGCIIAAAADHRLMSRGNGRIGLPELLVGVPFPPLPLEIIAARVSPAVLRDLIYGGRTLLAEDALTFGLIDEVVEARDLLARGVEVATRLSTIPAQAFALTKRAFTDSILDRVRAAAEREREVMNAWLSPEVHAAIRRYLAALKVAEGRTRE